MCFWNVPIVHWGRFLVPQDQRISDGRGPSSTALLVIWIFVIACLAVAKAAWGNWSHYNVKMFTHELSMCKISSHSHVHPWWIPSLPISLVTVSHWLLGRCKIIVLDCRVKWQILQKHRIWRFNEIQKSNVEELPDLMQSHWQMKPGKC